MVKVLLEIASNGVIKTVVDDNINGAGDRYERKTVYDFEKDSNFKNRIQFLFELCEELDIETGNKFDKINLEMKTDWGTSYMPTEGEIDNKIKELNSDLKYLKSLKKDMQEETE
jgi:hypothetical protein